MAAFTVCFFGDFFEFFLSWQFVTVLLLFCLETLSQLSPHLGFNAYYYDTPYHIPNFSTNETPNLNPRVAVQTFQSFCFVLIVDLFLDTLFILYLILVLMITFALVQSFKLSTRAAFYYLTHFLAYRNFLIAPL